MQMGWLIALAALNLCVLAALCFVLVKAFARIGAKLQQYEDGFISFVTASDEKAISPLAQTIDAAAKTISAEITQSFAGMLMGKASALGKNLDAMASEGAANSNPLLGMLMNFSPSLRKRASNPMLGMFLSQVLQGMAGAKGSNGGHSSTESPRFKLS